MTSEGIDNALRDQAIAIMQGNDRGGYTIPTKGLYPFQWNWDSGFAALGFAEFDEPRAWTELERLFEGQWDDGMVPHIVFHQRQDSYFPGPDVWGTTHEPPTTGITQPPVLATVALYMVENAKDPAPAAERAAALYPKILAWHRWWWGKRDLDGSGLVTIYHPWESGRDNSPIWDEVLARVEPTKTSYRRRDLELIDASHRPHNYEYDRYLFLVELFREAGYDPAAMAANSPFKVQDVGTNAILQGGNRDLLSLAERFGSADKRAEIPARIALSDAAFDRLWSPERSLYFSYDLIAGRQIDIATSASFLPFFGRVPDEERARLLADQLRAWGERCRWLVPSLHPDESAFEPHRYWRGPVWFVINWLIGRGLDAYGFTDLERRVRQDTLDLAARSGLHEHYSPVDGQGGGGDFFTRTAAVALSWGAVRATA